MKYVKKPIPVEAFKLPDNYTKQSPSEWASTVPGWFVDAVINGTIIDVEGDLYINTLEGAMYAPYGGCYIIKGVNGELYPCRTEIFEKTYEVYKE